MMAQIKGKTAMQRAEMNKLNDSIQLMSADRDFSILDLHKFKVERSDLDGLCEQTICLHKCL